MAADKDTKQTLMIVGGVAAAGVVGYLFYRWWSGRSTTASGASKAADEKKQALEEIKKLHDVKLGATARREVDKAMRDIDLRQVQKLTEKQITALWANYDADKSGFLDKSEFHALVQRVLKSLNQDHANTTNLMKNMFPSDVAPQHHEAIGERLKGLNKQLHEESDLFAEELWNRLDENHDGKVSKTEFLSHFGQLMEKKIDSEIRDYLT